ncbi:MAG TPA: DUF1236 domain-containing protein [Beijerinckiaceae bacterium]|nr:DUF1236 domain-containing protein [Beijerinckiaceae bacterium]
MKRSLIVGAFILAGAIAQAHAQGVAGGIRQGSREGARAAGPVGGFVGGVVGGVTGGIAGLLGADQEPRFREYVVREHRPDYEWRGRVAVGEVLPERGIRYYEVPREYGVRRYRYTVVDHRTVLVDPRTHRIVQVID